MWAHWLQSGTQGGYDYGVRITQSNDGGQNWSEPWTPHDDGTPTEHGFVSSVSLGQTMGFIWLDGRQFAAAEQDESVAREMTLRYREMGVKRTTLLADELLKEFIMKIKNYIKLLVVRPLFRS